MTKYFAGSTLAAFYRTSPAIVESTTGGAFDSTFVNCAITVANDGTYAESWPFVATGTIWSHFEIYTTVNLGGVAAQWMDGISPLYRLSPASGTTMVMQYWNGTIWVTAGSSWTHNVGRNRYDVKIIPGTSFSIYLAGTLVMTGPLSTGTQITSIRLYGVANLGTWWSQILLADFDTRDSRYMTVGLNGDSASNTGGTGAYTDINETVLDESTNVNITVSGNKQGQTHATMTVPTGYVISAAVTNARGRVTGGITDGKLGFRIGGVNYSSAGLGFPGAYEPRGLIWETDPSTSARWTQAGYNAAEVYEEAV